MKIQAGLLKGRSVSFEYGGEKPRPTTGLVRNALFNILGDRVTDAAVLDLFAGTGLVGFEAFSRGASEVTFVEHDARLASSIADSIKKLEVKGKVLHGQAFGQLAKLNKSGKVFDLIFIDPPYGGNQANATLTECFKDHLVTDEGVIVVERHEKDAPLSESELALLKAERFDTRDYSSTVLDFYRLIQK